MIKNFKCKETNKIWREEKTQKFPLNIQRKALIKLLLLNGAKCLSDLRLPPANRLHKLIGDRDGEYSISINMQYRICFKWEDNNAIDVEIIDYH